MSSQARGVLRWLAPASVLLLLASCSDEGLRDLDAFMAESEQPQGDG